LFHDTLYYAYKEEMSGERNVLFKMKELWSYLHISFDTKDSPQGKMNQKTFKQIRKSQRLSDYESALYMLRSSPISVV
ncbi:MAG: hypothetical protein K5886_01125, partial [Lachnospiraceae bacterium]|nr:hypothetical protein [Lachnospiraceae bacterium]